MDQFTVNIQYTEAFLKKAARTFLFRELGWGFFLALGLFVILMSYLWMGSDATWRGGLIGVCVVLIIFLMVIWQANMKRAKLSAADIGNATVNFSLDREALGFKSPLGSGVLPWTTLKSIDVMPDVILIRFRRGGYTSLPTTELTDEMMQLLRRLAGESAIPFHDSRK